MPNSFRNDSPIFLCHKFRSLWVVRPHHSVCLAAPCLPISKHCAVIALEHIFNQAECTFIVNLLLSRLCTVYHVESVGPWFLISVL